MQHDGTKQPPRENHSDADTPPDRVTYDVISSGITETPAMAKQGKNHAIANPLAPLSSRIGRALSVDGAVTS